MHLSNPKHGGYTNHPDWFLSTIFLLEEYQVESDAKLIVLCNSFRYSTTSLVQVMGIINQTRDGLVQ